MNYLVLIISITIASLAARSEHVQFKICVPESVMSGCEKMIEQGKSVGVDMTCIPARDRINCITKIKEHKADFGPADPEDMYLAAKMANEKFSIIKTIRTKEEPEAEFRYEAVAVVHKDLDIKNLHGLKGLRSCHTGVGRNVGYKIPITKLTKMGILPPLNDISVSPRENELKSLSQFFSKACLVGKWSPHQETDLRLKTQYSNLCELCEHPDKCDYPDVNSGYEGTLNCLTKGGGQIAWTKVIFVKKFFGMPYGMQPAIPSEHNPADYAYFCPDATKRPITGPPCSWAARPWPGYMANKDLTSEFKELQDQISKLNNLGESSHAEWIASVLALNNKTVSKDITPVSVMDYLEKAKYLDVIERGNEEPKRLVRICTYSKIENDKCHAFDNAAFSRDVRPSLDCVNKNSLKECFENVRDNKAEVVIVDPQETITAEESYNLKPLLMEKYGHSETQKLTVVIKGSSSINSLGDLKGKRACLQPYGKSGFTGAIKILLDNGLISKHHCPYVKALRDFFSGGVTETNDPLKCLESGKGDVAFVPYSAFHKTDGDVAMLCPSGRLTLANENDCDMLNLPPRLVLSSRSLTSVQQDDILFSLIAAANLYSKNPNLFLMFGPFKGESSILFSDFANGLAAVSDVLPSYEAYKKLSKELSICKA